MCAKTPSCNGTWPFVTSQTYISSPILEKAPPAQPGVCSLGRLRAAVSAGGVQKEHQMGLLFFIFSGDLQAAQLRLRFDKDVKNKLGPSAKAALLQFN